jgi:hypothetical protein
VTSPAAGSGKNGTIGQYEEPEEIQKVNALDATGKTWREWVYRDFLRYFIWTLALFEALILIGIIAYATGISQFNPFLISGITLLSILLNYFLVYRRFWKKEQEKPPREQEADIFERIK